MTRSMLVCAAAVAALGCGGGITDPPIETLKTTIQLQSDAGDWVGGGRSYSYSLANAVIAVSFEAGLLSIDVDGNEWWSGWFKLPGSPGTLRNGTWQDVQRYPFHNDAAGGISWSGEGRGCNTILGSFTIEKVRYKDSRLEAFVLRFEQRCEQGTAVLRGTITWDATDKTVPPGPVTPIPASLWQPTSIPAGTRYVRLESDAGDYIGQGRTWTYSGSDVTVESNGGLLTVRVTGPAYWFGYFQAMTSVPQMRVGYYGDLIRYPFHNPVKGGLSWSGEGRGCNRLRGWFVIDNIAFTNGAISALAMRFEQRCEDMAPALRGAIRWTAQ